VRRTVCACASVRAEFLSFSELTCAVSLQDNRARPFSPARARELLRVAAAVVVVVVVVAGGVRCFVGVNLSSPSSDLAYRTTGFARSRQRGRRRLRKSASATRGSALADARMGRGARVRGGVVS